MSQQSNPATLREALTKLVANWRAEHGRYPIKGCGSCADELEEALAASGTEAAPPVRSASSKTTENGLRDVGTVTRAQVSSAEGSVATSTPKRGPRTANHLEHVQRFLTEMYQVMVDPVEEFNGNIEQLCALLIARAKQDRETIHGRGRGERYLTESQKAVEEAAGMNLDWNMAAGYDAGQLSAQAAASPEAAPRCAHCRAEIISCSGQELGCQGWTHRYGLSHYCTNAYGETSENGTVAAPMSSNSFTVGPDGTSPYHVNNVPAAASPEGEGRDRDSEIFSDGYTEGYQNGCIDTDNKLRQSAAPSGREATRAEAEVWLEQNGYPYLEQLFNEFVDGPITRSRMNSLLAPLFAQFVLAQESKTGAVTPIANQICRCGHGVGQHEWEDRTTSMCLFQPCSCTGFAPETGAVTETK